MRQHFLAAVKTIWIFAILATFAWYLLIYWQEFVSYASQVGLPFILASLVLLLIARLFLAGAANEALRGALLFLPFASALWIYSLSQMARYIPGSIWHYVGRVAFYRNEGIPAKKAIAVLTVESAWLLGTASAFGVALSMPQIAQLSPIAIGGTAIAAAIALVVIGWWVAMTLGTRFLARRFGLNAMRTRRAAILQVLTWISFGLAFWLILPPELRTIDLLLPAMGTYAIAWTAGYIAPFAPAGIGVREGVIIALLSGLLEPSGAVAAAAMSRLIFTAMELCLGLVAGARYRRSSAKENGDSTQ